MRRVLLLGLALAVVGGLGVTAVAELTKAAPAGWSDPEAHVVDGLWFGAETACQSRSRPVARSSARTAGGTANDSNA